MRFEYATVEWIWTDSTIQVNLPAGEERTVPGGHNEVVATLGGLGDHGWEVATCAAAGNWLLWTLRRPH